MKQERLSKDKFFVEPIEKDFDDTICDESQGICTARVVNESHCVCPNVPITPAPNIPVVNANVVIKTPVVLAELNITIPVVARIKLEERVAEIKRIRKNVFINQCHLIPGSISPTPPFTGIVVIAGFVRKNIEYATRDCTGRGVMSGRIKHTTVDIPFECTTTVTFAIRPVFIPNIPPTEIETLQNVLRGCDPCSENISGSNPCERNFAQTEFFNERVFCELVSAAIFESDIVNNPTLLGCESPIDHSFNELTEKMVVNVTLKLLQNLQVRVFSAP